MNSLIEVSNFETYETLPTGELLPVRKDAGSLFDIAIDLGGRLNVAFRSSTVCKGEANGVVFATGRSTQIGTITASLQI